jgi:hypothetical protein
MNQLLFAMGAVTLAQTGFGCMKKTRPIVA